jgi:hypothetical protein
LSGDHDATQADDDEEDAGAGSSGSGLRMQMYRVEKALLLIDIVVEWQRSHSRTSGGRTSLVSASNLLNDDAFR